MDNIYSFKITEISEIYTLSLHDALPISRRLGYEYASATHTRPRSSRASAIGCCTSGSPAKSLTSKPSRSEEHTSELQSHVNLVCRLLLEKKNNDQHITYHHSQQFTHSPI